MLINGFIANNKHTAPDQVWGPAGQGDGGVSSTSATTLGLWLSSAAGACQCCGGGAGTNGTSGTALSCLPKPPVVESKAELGSGPTGCGGAAITR